MIFSIIFESERAFCRLVVYCCCLGDETSSSYRGCIKEECEDKYNEMVALAVLCLEVASFVLEDSVSLLWNGVRGNLWDF